ncbi:MAG TPA: beta galactosidase jelly roll domain-containing protein, partial [Solirubrobacteraceae bacterium]
MTLPRRLTIATLALVLALPAAAAAAPVPPAKTVYRDGPSGRYLLEGKWLFRMDKANQGLSQGFAKQTAEAGWSPVTVPNAWNAGDDSNESFQGTVGWYRKDFNLPSAKRSVSWVVRFESVNYRSRVYLNGRLIGTNAGAYLPFEVRLPASLLKRGGTNRLVVRVENKRFGFDFPPAGLSITGAPTGGWWNYGGLLREVYLR